MITDITFANGLSIGDYSTGILIQKLNGFGFPEIDVDMQKRGSYHGARLGDYSYGKRALSIEGEIIGSSTSNYETLRRNLQKAVDLFGGEQTIQFTTRAGLLLQADCIIGRELDQPYEAGNMIRGKFLLQLLAKYPYLLSQTENSEEVTPATGGGGAVPSAIPFSLGSGGTGAQTITNDGNAKAYPTIRIDGAIENPSLSNQTTGEQLSLLYTLSTSTEYIEIDTYNRTVLLNGSTNIRQYFSGTFFTLASGDNSIKLTSSSYSGTAKATLTYRDSYLGI